MPTSLVIQLRKPPVSKPPVRHSLNFPPASLRLRDRCSFLFTVGSFLLTAELLCSQLCFGASLLTIWAFLLIVRSFCLQLELLCLQWESASKKHLKGLWAKKLELQVKKLPRWKTPFHPETNYHSWFLAPRSKLQENRFSGRKIGCPTEKCTFLQKNALSCRKKHFPAEKCTLLPKNASSVGHMAGNHRKLQAGFRAQESRTLANFHKTPFQPSSSSSSSSSSWLCCLNLGSPNRSCSPLNQTRTRSRLLIHRWAQRGGSTRPRILLKLQWWPHQGKTARIQKKEAFVWTPPNRYGPSSFLSNFESFWSHFGADPRSHF